MPTPIGIVGIGAMGWPMAMHLQRLGVPAVVRDIDAARTSMAMANGLEVADSPAALARRCDIVLIVVVDGEQCREVLFGDSGITSAPRPPDAPRLAIVICSTIAAADTIGFADRLSQHGIDVVDAPISGGPARADNGTLSMMVAADTAVFQRCEATLRRLASSLHCVGARIGDAARVKLVNNMLAAIHLAAGAEAMALATRLGLDPRLLLRVIEASSGASWIVSDRMHRLLAKDLAPRARLGILTKDVGLALDMATEAGVEAPLAAQALAEFRNAVDAGHANDDDAALILSRCALP